MKYLLHSSSLSLWRRFAVARLTASAAASPVGKAASPLAATGSAATVAGGVGPKPFGTGGELRQRGPGELESGGDRGLVIEAKSEKARLPRWS